MIKTVLWDIDGTLLDFQKSESYAIKKCFEIFNLGECTDEMIQEYSALNDKTVFANKQKVLGTA